MTLHIVNQTRSHSALSDALQLFAQGDYLLLIEDGVYCAAEPQITLLEPVLGSVGVLSEDAQSRGILTRLPDSIHQVSMADFVSLSEQHTKSISWF